MVTAEDILVSGDTEKSLQGLLPRVGFFLLPLATLWLNAFPHSLFVPTYMEKRWVTNIVDEGAVI